MPSILERLRKRTLSHRSSASAQLTELPVSPQAASNPLPSSRSEPSLVDRRIVEDLPALLGALEREVDDRGALKPPRPRKRSGLGSLVTTRRSVTSNDEEQTRSSSDTESPEASSGVGSLASSRWKGKSRATGPSQQDTGTTTSPWSTFGRHRQRPRNLPYGGYTHSRRGSHVAPSAFYGSSSSHAGGQHSASGPTSASQSLHGSQSNPSRVSVAMISSESSQQTFGGHSEKRAKSPSVPSGPPAARVPFPPSADNLVAHMPAEAIANLNSIDPYEPPSPSIQHHECFTLEEREDSQHDVNRALLPRTPCSLNEHPIAESQPPAETVNARTVSRSGPEGGDGRLLPSASAEPHAQHASSEGTEPCSPSRFIPPSSPLPTSPTLLDAENRSDGVLGNLSRSSNDLCGREDDIWMAEPRDATNTFKSQPSDTRGANKKGLAITPRAGTHVKARSRRISQLSEPSTPTASTSKENGGAGPSSSTVFPTTPESPTPVRVPRTPRTASEPGLRSVSEKSVLETPVNTKGKRKADEVDTTPPDQRAGQHAKFVLPEGGHRSHHVSEVSRAPSSYQGRKRARLSTAGSSSPTPSRPASVSRHPTDSWPSRSAIPASLHRAASKTASMRSGARPESMIAAAHRNSSRRKSLSEISIPISALIAPHAPSVSVRSSMYHMRDPRKPPRIHPTPWSLELRTQDSEGSPIHAWFFFVGFVLFPLWYVASVWRIPETRQVGGTDTEKAVTLDDPQVEHDARTWRKRCRIMSVVSLFTYIPFIVLVAIFVPRS